ncbi:hypothetical protein BPAE_0072g00170 [Botrytis paeoniae]|uniref:Uncharacterized protein n=1 Tax=Botrytis paeoniae TaxID=278948 RepID=A0A4Z1FVM0_9HELO|nr:hypothetical protein BPAE_0072g00170 [Botrytis paeoniae]
MKTQTILQILLATAHLAVAQDPIREPEAEVAGGRFPVPATKETTIAQAFGSSNSGANQQAVCECYPDDGTNAPSLTAATSQEQGANSDSGTSFTHIVDTTPPKRPWKRQRGGEASEEEDPEAQNAAGGWKPKPKPKPTKPEEAAASASVDATQVGINAAGGAGSASGPWGAVSYAGPSIGANYQDIDGNCVCPPGQSPHKPKGPNGGAPAEEGGATGPSTGGPSTGGPSGGRPEGGRPEGGNGNGSGNGNGNGNGNLNGNENEDENKNKNKNKNENENENENENKNENLNANINKNENVNINGNANANINKNLGLNFGSNSNGWGSWFGSKAAAVAADPAASGTPVAASDASGIVGATDESFVPEASNGDVSGVEQFTGAGSSIAISAWGFLAAVFAIANVL